MKINNNIKDVVDLQSLNKISQDWQDLNCWNVQWPLIAYILLIWFDLIWFNLIWLIYLILFNWFDFIGWTCFWWLLWPELSNCVRTHITLMTFFTRLTRLKLCKCTLVPNSLYDQQNEDEWGRLRKMRKTEILLLWFNYSRQFFVAPLKAIAATFILSSPFSAQL